jgi:hypothetical protein
MKRILASCLLVLAIAGLVVSTSGADIVSHDETDVLELEPAGEGTYTQIDDETGEIQIILTEENPNLDAGGVNDDAVTNIGPVFTVENVLNQGSNATVWISHDSDAVEFYVPGEGTVESQADGVFMQRGDSETIAMRVDTRETDEITLDSINVMSVLDPDVESESEDGAFESFGNIGSGDTNTPETDTPPGDTETETPGTETPSATAIQTETGDSESESGTPASTAEPTPTPTDNPTGELTGLDPAALLGLFGALGGLLLLFALARRRRGGE